MTSPQTLRSRITSFVESRGTSPSELPAVLATFVALKWSLWIGMVGVCWKFRPIRRLCAKLQSDRASTLREAAANIPVKASKLANEFVRDQRVQAYSEKVRQWRRRNRHWKIGSIFHQRMAEQKQFSVIRSAASSAASRVQGFAEAAADKVAEQRIWKFVSKSILRVQNPKDLAMAMGESLVLFKLTYIIHAPVLLWLSAKWTVARRLEG